MPPLWGFKILPFTEEFAEKNPKTVKAILRAMIESSQHIDKLENRRFRIRGYHGAVFHIQKFVQYIHHGVEGFPKIERRGENLAMD